MSNRVYERNANKGRRLNVTPLHIAAKKNHENCLSALVRKFPHLVDSQNMYGETALFLAAKYGRVESVKILSEAKANHTEC